MFRTFIVGFGRSGHGLHWTVLRRLRRMPRGAGVFADEPLVVHDVDRDLPRLADPELVAVPDLAAARALLDPDRTVVHLCTPPTQRVELLRALAGLGFNRILVEKPLAVSPEELAAVESVREEYRLRLQVVAHWLQSSLTERLLAVVHGGDLGELQSIRVIQRKPRLMRTLGTQGHPTAFDVELPHSVGIALRLAGDAETVGAELRDMRVQQTVVPEMGSARLLLEHHTGVRTEIFSDLASPVRERSIRLVFTRGEAVGHYPVSETDDYAHLTTSADDDPAETVFRDDSLGRFLLDAYEKFSEDADLETDFRLNARVTTVLGEAKRQARRARLAEEAGEGQRPPREMEPEAGSHV